MVKETLNKILDSMNEAELLDLKKHIESRVADASAVMKLNGNKPACPACGSHNAEKNGKVNGIQRYKCICGKNFRATTGTCFYRARQRDKWQRFIDNSAIIPTMSGAAEETGINRKTAKRWRDKIVEAFQGVQMLHGLVQADVTELHESQKGTVPVGRPARKRGAACAAPAYFLTAACKAGAFAARVASEASADISSAFQKHLSRHSCLLTDKARAFVKSTEELGVKSCVINVSAGERCAKKCKKLNIQKINSLHSELKRRWSVCKGWRSENVPNVLRFIQLQWMFGKKPFDSGRLLSYAIGLRNPT